MYLLLPDRPAVPMPLRSLPGSTASAFVERVLRLLGHPQVESGRRGLGPGLRFERKERLQLSFRAVLTRT